MTNLFTIPDDPVEGVYTAVKNTEAKNLLRTLNNASYLTVSNNPDLGKYQSISDAIDALSEEGGIIFIKNGTYDITAVKALPDKTILFLGESKTGVIIDPGDGAYNTFSLAALSTGKEIVFRDLTFQNSSTDYFFDFSNPSSASGSIYWDNCKFDTYLGILTSDYIDSVRMSNSTFKDGDSGTAFIDCNNYSSLQIYNNSYDNAGLGSNELANNQYTTWLTKPPVSTSRGLFASFGGVSSAIAVSGATPSGYTSTCEEFNGESWSSITSYFAAVYTHGGCGSSIAGLVAGGVINPGSSIATTKEYDGSSFSSGGDLNTARQRISLCGTQVSAFTVGGYTDSSEEYNGSSWSTSDTWPTAGNPTDIGLVGSVSSCLAISSFQDTSKVPDSYEHTGAGWSSSTAMVLSGGPTQANIGTTDSAVSIGCAKEYFYSFSELWSSGMDSAYQSYDGTSWRLLNNFVVQTTLSRAVGSISRALLFGGTTVDTSGVSGTPLAYSYRKISYQLTEYLQDY
jgi:hypothetical protein